MPCNNILKSSRTRSVFSKDCNLNLYSFSLLYAWKTTCCALWLRRLLYELCPIIDVKKNCHTFGAVSALSLTWNSNVLHQSMVWTIVLQKWALLPELSDDGGDRIMTSLHGMYQIIYYYSTHFTCLSKLSSGIESIWLKQERYTQSLQLNTFEVFRFRFQFKICKGPIGLFRWWFYNHFPCFYMLL